MIVDFIVRLVFLVGNKHLALALENKEELITLCAVLNDESVLIELSECHVANRFLDGRLCQAPVLKEG